MKSFRILFFLLPALIGANSCSTQHKLERIKAEELRPGLNLPSDKMPAGRNLQVEDQPRDTLRIVDFEGRETIIMNAIRDEDGEMVATDRLTAAVVTARFRNVAERHGRVDLEFQVTVPARMRDSHWQLRMNPDMYILGDSLRLDPVIITGKDYRKAQLRGYEQYRRFIDSIITDTTRFINKAALEIFLERNIPQVFAFRNDSSYVSDEEFASVYGVTERQAVEHYTYKLLKTWNRRRASLAPAMYRRYVKVPIVTEGIRLDTVMMTDKGDFIYNYIQTVNTRPSLRKVDIVLSGGIWEQDKRVYTVPRSDALTFYISSISGLADNTERYLTKVIERRVEANTACYIEFPQGRSEVNPRLGNNPVEIGRIKSNLRSLLENETFDTDSIVVVAYASPEGLCRNNEELAESRARAASSYFSSCAREIKDSLLRDAGAFYSLDGVAEQRPKMPTIRFQGRSGGENWRMLDVLVASDTCLTKHTKDSYKRIADSEGDPDKREKELSRLGEYRYMREKLYPRLRIVKLNFYLHRKGMVKDTVMTTEPDTVYRRGVQCLRDHDYEGAILRLRPYSDYNTAVAYVALDRNRSALGILERLPKTAGTEYLSAIIFAREGDDQSAVQHYMNACAMEPSFVHRGNLDPEISALIRKYDLNLDKY